MDYGKLQLFGIMKTQMNYLAERQDVLAKTIANVDTPGYRPKDLKKLDFEDMASAFAQKLNVKVTDPKHYDHIKGKEQEDFKSERQRKTFETKPVKNRVTLEEQMMKMNENSFDYLTTSNLYTKTTQLFKTAIGNRG